MDTMIRTILQDTRGNLWFGGGTRGAYRYDGAQLMLFSEDDGLCSDNVIGIAEDHLGNLYFDTPECVSKFDGERFTTLEVAAASGVWKHEADDLWFKMGWDRRGPYRYDGDTLHLLEFPATGLEAAFRARLPNVPYEPRGVYEIYKDDLGNIWFGTAALGAARFDGETLTWLYERELTETPAGGDFGFRSIIQDSDGFFWLCNAEQRYEINPGITETDGTVFMNYQRHPGADARLPGDRNRFPYFQSMTRAPDGDLWMASYDDGVWHKSGKAMNHYPAKGARALTVYADRQGRVWLGTDNAGALLFDGERFAAWTPTLARRGDAASR